MKKLLAIILAAIILAACLASCAVAPDAAKNANVRITSSDASDASAWLSDRLGDRLTVPVVLGTDADGYGVDLSSLESDGYFIRVFGDEVALFARTTDGLDRAARRYAKMVEAGTVSDATYHEGCRVKKLTIAGNDIAEYAIVRMTTDDPCVATAANELSSYVKKACGVRLAVCTEAEFESTGAKRRIEISSGDEALGSDGFTISIDEDGTLKIAGGVWRGSYYGVLDLLEDIGWRFLAPTGSYFNDDVPPEKQEYLYEADHVDLTAALNRTEIPSIPIRGGVGGLRQRNTYSTRFNASYGGYGFTIRACHGLQNNHAQIFSGEFEGLYEGLVDGGNMVQPCFTNEDILEAIDNYALWSVQSRLDAGQQIGREIIDVDVAQWDGGTWTFCKCKRCQKVYAAEGAHTGAFLRMANRVAALLDENYPGVASSILAYAGTDKLPAITRPAHNVYVSFCYYFTDGGVSCQNHCISGEECQEGWNTISNRLQTERLEEWLEVTDPKMMQIWYYPFVTGNYCFNSPLLTVIRDDMAFFASKKIEHIYYCMDRSRKCNNGLILEGLTEYLGARFMWDADMSEDEELAVIREWYAIVFGEDAGSELFELAMFAERAGDLAGCWCSFSGGESLDRVNYDYVARHAEQVISKCRRAKSLAESADGERRIEINSTGYLYMVVRGCYDDMYVNGTPESRETISGIYREMWERMANYKLYEFDPEYFTEEFDPDVDPRLWLR